jgi:hypothetical protein
MPRGVHQLGKDAIEIAFDGKLEGHGLNQPLVVWLRARGGYVFA